MPTPSRTSEQNISYSHHSSCPPEDEAYNPANIGIDFQGYRNFPFPQVFQQSTPLDDTREDSMNVHEKDQIQVSTDDEITCLDKPSSITRENKESVNLDRDLPITELSSPLTAYDFSYIRVCCHCSYFRVSMLNSCS